jgi:hypothetical protein
MSGSTAPTFLQRLQRRLGFAAADAPAPRPASRLQLLQAAEARTRQLQLQLGEVLLLLRMTEERTRTLEYQLREQHVAIAAQAEAQRANEERTRTIEQQLVDERELLAAHENLQRATEERTRTMEQQLALQQAALEQQIAWQRDVQERAQALGAQQQHVVTAAQDGLALLRVTEERTRTLEAHLQDALSLAHTGDERTRTLESQLQDAVSLTRAGEERTRTLEHLLQDAAAVTRTAEERTRTLQHLLEGSASLVQVTEERTRTLESQLQDAVTVTRTAEERTRTLEHLLEDSANLVRVTEERSRSQHFELQQARFASDHELDLLHKWYVESPGRPGTLESLPGVVQARALHLETEHPIAEGSNDHLVPESTQEGIARPNAFISHCIDVLGTQRPLLDLGTGAGGLVYEALMQGLLAIGLDGSDHCRRRRIGYWPLLPDNLLTCDATKPFRFVDRTGATLRFGLVTMWEVLEHLPEADLPQVLANIRAHMDQDAWFMGTVSLLEYTGADGTPYHVTLRPRAWWQDTFRAAGLEMVEEHPFNARLFYRGNGPRFQDFHNYFSHPEEGFHFVARKCGDGAAR